jgi:hypothetical protein
MRNSVMKFLKKYDLHIVFASALVIAVVLMLFEKSKELGTNLLTEVTGVAMTVFIINKILERKERQKRISMDQRILREVQSIIASYFSIWKHLTWQYLPNERIKSEEDILRIYPDLVKMTSLHEKFDLVAIHHPESWKLFFHGRPIKDCFENYYDTLSHDIRVFIDDFKIYLEPELLDCLLNITEGTYFKNLYMMCHETEAESILIELEQNTDRLESYVSADDVAHLKQFLELINYSKRLKNTINKFGAEGVDLYQIRQYFTHPAQFVNQ